MFEINEQKSTKYFIFLDNSGSMKSYYKNVKNNLLSISHQENLHINPTILTFDDLTKELTGSSFEEKLNNYHQSSNQTYMEGVVERFTNYLIDAPDGKKICILFITDGAVHDLVKITPFLLACVNIIINKKLSVYVSCVAIGSSADMKAFSLFGLLNNFSVFQLIQSKNGDNWSKLVVNKFKEIESCDTVVYRLGREATTRLHPAAVVAAPEDGVGMLYSDIVVDSRVSESGACNKVYLAALVQSFIICNFGHTDDCEGFTMCKRLLKYVADLGINEKTRYIWSKLNTAKMVGDNTSNVIANEFISTINDFSGSGSITDERTTLDDTMRQSLSRDESVVCVNEHNVRVRLFVGKTKNFTQPLPITINDQNQIIIQSDGSNELYLNIEIYHPTEPVYLEISYGDSKHIWYVPYGVSLIQGDVNYLMLAHEKLKATNNSEQMFDFIIKAVPSSLTTKIKNYTTETDSSFHEPTYSCIAACKSFDDSLSCKSLFDYNDSFDDVGSACLDGFASLSSQPPKASAKAFATVSKEMRKIDTVKREYQINSNVHVLCFSFVFVYDSEIFDLERLSASEIVYGTKECVICLDRKPTIKFKCNHKCTCSLCYASIKQCPLCRQLI